MAEKVHKFSVRFAQDNRDIRMAQKLRYDVFVRELGAKQRTTGQIETDEFDDHSNHLILFDETQNKDEQAVGVYRIMSQAHAQKAGQFSCEAEYDLSPLLNSNRSLLELGRSCLHPEYRGGAAIYYLWQALAEHIEETKSEILFGVASFHGNDPQKHAGCLSLLHSKHLAPAEIRPHSKKPSKYEDLSTEDRIATMKAMPPLIKAYLRLGGWIGKGAYTDHLFNTVDVCMVLDLARSNEKQRALYERRVS